MERSERCIVCLALAALLFALVHMNAFAFGWDTPTRPNSHSGWEYAPGESLRAGRVFEGTVLATRDVRIEADRSDRALGLSTGALVGGILGNQVGKGSGKTLATIAGAVLGGWAGREIGESAGDTRAQELIVRLEDGRRVSVVQGIEGGYPLRPGDTVFLVENMGNYRVWR